MDVYIVQYTNCREIFIESVYADEQKAAKRALALDVAVKKKFPSDEAWYITKSVVL